MPIPRRTRFVWFMPEARPVAECRETWRSETPIFQGCAEWTRRDHLGNGHRARPPNGLQRRPAQARLAARSQGHIEVQRWIDGGALKGRAHESEAIREIHCRFFEHLPETMRWVESEAGDRARVVPGELRPRDVQVGRLVPISPGAVPWFLAHFEKSYRGVVRTDAILAAAAAHHRLVWIHPFLDGNGRVARLVMHAMLLDALDTGGIWSASRGLARGAAEYKTRLAHCDLPRRNDLDGRGSLSEEEFARLTQFFLET
jgi:Fic family protein